MMAPAAYTPTTLARIRAGATARELGWDDQFYRHVCDKHGLPKAAMATPAVIINERPVWIGRLKYDPATGIVSRGWQDVVLSDETEKAFFRLLIKNAKAQEQKPVSQDQFIEAIGQECSATYVRAVLRRLRVRLMIVSCTIDVVTGKKGGALLVVPK